MIEVHRLASAMARVQRLVARGFVFYTAGTLSLDKIERVIEKFHRLYGISESGSASRKRQRLGEARARITLWPEPEGLGFVLAATDGTGTVHQAENLQDAREPRQRVRIRHYELAQLPRPGDSMRWSWRLPPVEFQTLLDDGCSLARRPFAGAGQTLLNSQLDRPGFHGVRQQTKTMIRAMQQARRKVKQPSLEVPAVIPWIRASHRRCEPLGTWLAQERVRRAAKHVRISSVALDAAQ